MQFFILSGSSLSLITPDWGLLFWTTVVFVILWSLLGKFAFKPIAQSLKNRNEDIDMALNEAKKAREEMQALSVQNDALIKQAKEERNKILQEAKDTKESILKQAKQTAKVEAEKIMTQAKQEIVQQQKAALVEVKNQVAGISIEIAQKVLDRELSSEAKHDEYVASLVKEIVLN